MKDEMVDHVREEQPDDHKAVHSVLRMAFGQDAEADLVSRLRGQVDPEISLVATLDKAIVGHVYFSPVTVRGTEPSVHVAHPLALGPVAVAPEHQRRGIGHALIEAGLARCAVMRTPFVVVLGHPEYYPRFGFEPAFPHGLWFMHERPMPAFMVRVLQPGALRGVSGEVRYRPEFDGV